MQAFGTRAGPEPTIVGRTGVQMVAKDLFAGLLQAAGSPGEVAHLHLRIHADPGAHVIPFFRSAPLFTSSAGFWNGALPLAVT